MSASVSVSSGTKRSATSENDHSGTRRPGKREKYTRTACDSCKLRKVKCTGDVPCNRCIELNMICMYRQEPHNPARAREKDTVQQTETPQQDFGQLLSRITQLCDSVRISAASSYIPSQSTPLSYRALTRQRPSYGNIQPFVGRTSYNHTLNLAQKALVDRGVSLPLHHHAEQPAPTDHYPVTATFLALHQAALPILEVGYEEAKRYLAVFRHEVYPMYPCVNLDTINKNLDTLFTAFSPTASGQPQCVSELELIDVEILKLVLADAMSTEENNTSRLCLIWTVDELMKQEKVEVEDVIMGALLTIYYILRDEGVKAWRVAGCAAKLCVELGLHRARSPTNADATTQEERFLRILFCCVYDLDNRSSFTASLPSTLHDRDIEDEVFNLGSAHPFLAAMVSLNPINAEVFSLINATSPDDTISSERMKYLDFRVQELVENIDQERFVGSCASSDGTPSLMEMLMKSLFKLRVTQIRIMTRINALSSTDACQYQSKSVRTLVSLAQTMVTLYLEILATGKLSQFLRQPFDRMVMSSVCYIFLAACYNPNEYGPMCRGNYYTAISFLSQANYRLCEGDIHPWCNLVDLQRLPENVHTKHGPSPPRVVGAPQEVSNIRSPFHEQYLLEGFDMTKDGFLSALGEVISLDNISSLGIE